MLKNAVTFNVLNIIYLPFVMCAYYTALKKFTQKRTIYGLKKIMWFFITLLIMIASLLIMGWWAICYIVSGIIYAYYLHGLLFYLKPHVLKQGETKLWDVQCDSGRKFGFHWRKRKSGPKIIGFRASWPKVATNDHK